MVLSSTLQAVKNALAEDPQSIGEICQRADFSRNAVVEALDFLIEIGKAEKVSQARPSGKKGGWIRVGYRLQSK